ncbi:MAG: NnrU family protein [Thermaurantimonas sp.]|uniref:NnrU family protein n=1 Tax=Thermaurantimonas sp. TaxID=2681568 RepID=UPI00391DAEB6
MKLALSLVFYYFMHSLLAAPAVKKFLTHRLSLKNYRLLYSLTSVILLAIPVIFYLNSPSNIYLNTGIAGRLVLLTLALLSYRVFVLSFRRVRLSEFLGLQPTENNQLIVTGIYRHLRHPLYFATISLLAGLFAAVPSEKNLILLSITSTYVIIGAMLEEGRLIQEFGDKYVAYRRQTPMLLPNDPFGFLRFVIRNP